MHQRKNNTSSIQEDLSTKLTQPESKKDTRDNVLLILHGIGLELCPTEKSLRAKKTSLM